MTPFSLHNCCNPPRHALNQILTHLWLYLVPFHLYSLPQLQNATRCPFILPQPLLQVIPKVFNGVQVRRLCWPQEDLDILGFKIIGGHLGPVFGVTILLEDDGGGILAIEGKAFLEFILQDLGVEICIQLPPIACSPTSSEIHHQTSQSPSPTCHSAPPQPSSIPISSHLTPDD